MASQQAPQKKKISKAVLGKGGPGTVSIRVRVSVDVHEELQARLNAKATLSDLVDQACRQAYLPGGLEPSLEVIHKRLLQLETRGRQHEVKQQVTLEAMLLAVRTWLMATPALSDEEKNAARPSADLRLGTLMDVVANTVGSKRSVIGGSVRLTDLLFGPEGGPLMEVDEPGAENNEAEEQSENE